MSKNPWYDRINRAGMIQQGHVVLSSGYHTDTYVNCALPLIKLDPIVDELVAELGRRIRPAMAQKTGVMAFVSVGKGCLYAEKLARWCRTRFPDSTFLFAFAQRTSSGSLFLPYNQRRLLKSAEVIVVDDAHMTGRTFKDLAHLMNGSTAGVLQYLTIVNRSHIKTIDDGNHPFIIESILDLPDLNMWESRESCPLCAQGIPLSTSIEGGLNEFMKFGQPSKNA